MSGDKKVGCGTIAIIIVCIMALLGSCGDKTSTYEQDLNSGWNKFSRGDYGSMTDGERDAVEDFLDWTFEN